MEMIEDILREMSGLAKEIRGNSISNAYELLMGLADRIEAAIKSQFRDVTKMETTTPTCDKSSQVGNAAAMREALSDACHAMFNFLKTQYGSCYEEMAKALDKAKSALSKPPRNCDLYKTQEEAYGEWKRNRGSLSEESFYYEDWLFAEAKGKAK